MRIDPKDALFQAKLGESYKADPELSKAAQDFETIFLDMVLQSMRKTIPESKLLSGGNAEEIYRSLLDQEYTKLMASQKQLGLAAQIESYVKDIEKDRGKHAYQSQAPLKP